MYKFTKLCITYSFWMNMYATNSAKPFMWVSYWFLRIVYEVNTKYNYAHFIDQQTEALIKCFALGNAATELLSPVLNQSLSETQTYALKHNTFLSCTFLVFIIYQQWFCLHHSISGLPFLIERNCMDCQNWIETDGSCLYYPQIPIN